MNRGAWHNSSLCTFYHSQSLVKVKYNAEGILADFVSGASLLRGCSHRGYERGDIP